MAETLEQLQQQRDAAEAAARLADIDAGNGVPGATARAESLHREAAFYGVRIARLEADPGERLASLYTERAVVVTAGRIAEMAAAKGEPDAAQQVEALAAKLASLDRQIDKLENPNGTVQ